MSFPDQLWDRSCWASSDKGSRYGIMTDSALAFTGIDWTGAIAVLNVAHQFVTWTRVVSSHEAGTPSFTYEKNLEPITHYADKTRQWRMIYYLTGKLEALDQPGEWFLDRERMELYLWSPGGENPDQSQISYKARDYAFVAEGNSYIHLKGFVFFANTVKLVNVNHSLVEACVFKYPVYNREFRNPDQEKNPAETLISGDDNIFRGSHILYSQHTGIRLSGEGNRVENNLIHDVAWNGEGFAIQLHSREGGRMSVIKDNTAFNTGYAVIQPGGGLFEVSYNHVHHGALVSKDCALIHTGNWSIRGSSIITTGYTTALPPGIIRVD